MKLESVVIPDDVAHAVDQRWPDATWSEVVERALTALVDAAPAVDDEQLDVHDDEQLDVHDDEQLDVADDGDLDVLDDLEARIAAALGSVTA